MANYSVIVPVYNVAGALEECLNSLLQQTLQPLQIIAVNDGSSDRSLAIIESYASRHPHIHVINQPNSGVSVARNVGLAAATGDYVAFLDSDDFVAKDYYETLLNKALRHQLDISGCSGYFYYPPTSGKPMKSLPELPEALNVTGEAWLQQVLPARRFRHFCWMFLYKREFLQGINVRFIPGRLHEDVLWMTEVLLLARQIAYSNQYRGYYYRQRDPATLKLNTDRSLYEASLHTVYNARDLLNLVQNRTMSITTRRLLIKYWGVGDSTILARVKQIKAPALRRKAKTEILALNYFATMWPYANLAQKIKLARYFLKCWIARRLGERFS